MFLIMKSQFIKNSHSSIKQIAINNKLIKSSFYIHTLALIISHNYHSICAILHKSLTMSRIRVMCIHEEKYVNHRGSEYCHEML